MMQVPAVTIVANPPVVVVQVPVVSDVNVTALPDPPPVAVTGKVPSPKVGEGAVPNVIAWFALFTVNDCETGVAAR